MCISNKKKIITKINSMKKHLLFLIATLMMLLASSVVNAQVNPNPDCNITITHPTRAKAVISGGGTICYGTTTTITITVSGGKAPWKLTIVDENGTKEVTVTDVGNNGSEVYTYTTDALTANITYNSGNISLTDDNSCTNGLVTGSADVEINDPAKPTGDAAQSFCSIDTPTIADLSVNETTTIKWYSRWSNILCYSDGGWL